MIIDMPTVSMGNSGSVLPADKVSYDNTTSGLEAENVQDAIDEVNSNLDDFNAYKSGDVISGNQLFPYENVFGWCFSNYSTRIIFKVPKSLKNISSLSVSLGSGYKLNTFRMKSNATYNIIDVGNISITKMSDDAVRVDFEYLKWSDGSKLTAEPYVMLTGLVSLSITCN